MAYERSYFGDGSTAGNGNVVATVHNHYGPRDEGKTQGVIKTEGGVNEITIDLDGEMVSNEAFPLMAPILRAYGRVQEVYLEVEEAFDLGTASGSATVEVGTEGSEATNGVTLTESELETPGVYDVTDALAGTWAAAGGFTDEVTVGIDLAGDTPTSDVGAGKARLVIRYVKV